MMFKNSYQRIFLTLCFGISVLLFWGCKGASEEQVIQIDAPMPHSYQYSFKINYEDESIEEGSASSEDLVLFIREHCIFSHHNDTRYIPYTSCGVRKYSYYRGYVCTADLLMEIANDPNGVTLDRNPVLEECQFGNNWSAPFLFTSDYVQNESGSPAVSVHFEPVETVNHTQEARNLAIPSYNYALGIVREFIDGTFCGSPPFYTGEELRTHMYEGDGDYCFSADPEFNGSTGTALVDQMFASYPTIISTIKEIKMDCAEEMMLEGAGQNDEWGSEEYGRLPALRHMIGSVRIDDLGPLPEDDEFEVVDLSLLPNNFQFPEVTNSLKNAISLLARQNILPTADVSALDVKNVMWTVNQRRRELGQIVFTEPENMAKDYGTSVLGLKQAYQYMYSHMLRFPRIPSQAAGSPEWANPHMASPPGFYSRDFFTRWNSNAESDPFFFLMNEDGSTFPSVLIKTGLTMHLTPIERKHYVTLDNFNKILGGISEEALITEENILMHYNAGATAFKDALGKKRVIYRLSKTSVDSTDFTLRGISVKNPTVDEETGESLDKIRIYPIGETEGPEQLSSFACIHMANKDPNIDTQCDAFISNIYELSLDTCEPDVLDGMNQCYHYPFYPLVGSQYWMVEMKTEVKISDGEEEVGAWYPVGVLANDSYFFETTPSPDLFVKHGMFLVEGRIKSAISRILAFDDSDLNGSMCVPINGLEYTCLDRDWVPTIDNEIIDDIGNRYEDSYRHYLKLARTAAQDARQMRERLMDNIISEVHDKSLMEAQYNAALDKYLSNIIDICGQENIISDFEKIVEYVIADATPENFESELLAAISSYYGCEADNKDTVNASHNYKWGPVHCYLDRNCSVENPATLGKLGVLKKGRSNMIGTNVGSISSSELDSDHGFSNYAIPGYVPLDDNTRDELNTAAEGAATGVAVGSTNADDSEILLSPGNMMYPGPVLQEMTTGDFNAINQSFKGMTAFAQQYPAHAKWVIQSEPLYKAPNNLMAVVNSPGGPNYGRLFEKLAEMGITIEKVQIVAESLIAEGYNVLYLMKILHDSTMLNDAQGELQKAQTDMILKQQIASALLQGMVYLAQYEDTERKCLEDLHRQYIGGSCKVCAEWETGDPNNPHDDYCKVKCGETDDPQGKSVKDFEHALISLNDALANSQLRKDQLHENNDKGEFLTSCKAAARKVADPILAETPEHGRKTCEFIADNYWPSPPDVWFEELKRDEWKSMYVTTIEHGYRIGLPYNNKCFEPELKNGCDRSRITPTCPAIAMRAGPWFYASKLNQHWVGYVISSATESLYCEDMLFAHNEFSGYRGVEGIHFHLIGNLGGRGGMAEKARIMMGQWEFEECIRRSGCRDMVGGPDYPGVFCDGAASDATTSAYLDWIKMMAVDDALGIKKIKNKIDTVTYWENVLAYDKYQQAILTTITNISSAKHEIKNLIRQFAIQNSQLMRLEDEQISHFYTFINDLSLAYASSYSTLTEWQDRYDFRRDEYRKQVKRARIAAWVARRAIEFRFGIDLTKEDSRTIHGDKPSDWANDIYKTAVAECGKEGDNETKFSGCLAQEDRIEDYVQKLEDYVESYGNSPDQGWWVHEDDDTGVISLRDHLAMDHLTGGMVTNNLLFFSEEMDMDDSKFTDTYLIEDGLDDDFFLEYPDPAVWKWDPEKLSVNPDGDEDGYLAYLGVHERVRDAHRTNERGIFADQEEEFTADLLQSLPGVEANLYQALSGDNLDELVVATELDFSVYLRKNPIDKVAEDCEDDETFFLGIGRCGIACELDEVNPIQGNCEDGQVCMKAGSITDEETETQEDIYMCDWCTADRTCIKQDGQAVKLEIQKEEYLGSNDWRVFQANAVAYPFWARQHVNTVDYLWMDYHAEENPNPNSVIVSIKNTKTKNLIKSSEKYDTDKGWDLDDGAIYVGHAGAPDGTENGAERFEFTGSNGYIGIEAVIVPLMPGPLPIPLDPYTTETFHYTGSVWLKMADGYDKQEALLMSKKIEIGTEWKRYQASTKFTETRPSSVGLAVEQIENSGQYEIDMWGAQLEEGAGATPYIPTGKNLLPWSTDWNKWTCQYGADACSIEESDDKGPAGSGGVYMLSDTSTSVHPFIGYESIYGNFEEDEYYTFSVWMKTVDGNSHSGIYIFLTELLDDTVIDYTGPNYEVDGDWRRYDRTYQIKGTNGQPSNRFKVHIFPEWVVEATGSILVWGPQFEKGEFATGYQETVAKNLLPESRNLTKWIQANQVETTISSETSDDGNKGVFLVDDNSTVELERIRYYIDGDFIAGEQYTLSVDLKDADSNGHDARIIMHQHYNGDTVATPDNNNNAIIPVNDSSWTTATLTVTITDTSPIDRLQVDISPSQYHPGTDSILVYAPQVEKGTTRTEYQPTGGPPNILPDGDMEDTTPCDANGCGYWIAGADAALSKQSDGNGGQVLRVAYQTSPDSYAEQQNITEWGNDYRITGRVKSYNGGRVGITNDTGAYLWTEPDPVNVDWINIDFTYQVAAYAIQLANASTSGYSEFDNIRIINITEPDPTRIDSYEKDWGLDVGVVGAQLTPTGTFPCDEYGVSVFVNSNDSEYSCDERQAAIRADCCSRPWNWYGEGIPELFYQACMTCGESGQAACDTITEGDALACEPAELCKHYVDEADTYTCAHGSTTYNRNTYLREHVEPGFEVSNISNELYPVTEDLNSYISSETRQELFKSQFTYFPSTDESEDPGYYAYWFNINIDDIESGAFGQFGVLAPNNFNYRVRTVAANIVGIDAINCSYAETPETCAANPWITYDLKQMGDVRIRNHHKENSVRGFNIPTGRVSGGKAWVAEQVIGFPISGAHQTALQQLQKVSMMGRPLQGTYELRIYDTQDLIWPNVEDIQIVLGYHYWTRSE